MPKISEIAPFYGDQAKLRETSYTGLRAGDIVSLTYNGEPGRFGIVVKSKRTSTGLFISSRNNTLLNVFLLDSISLDMFDIVVNNLYKNRIRCTYKNSPRILGAFLKDGFRTFNVSRISNLFKLDFYK